MSVIIFFMAVAFSDINSLSSVRTRCVLDGSFAKANDVAVTDEVTTSETTRLRMKERENKAIITSGRLPTIACADRSASTTRWPSAARGGCGICFTPKIT